MEEPQAEFLEHVQSLAAFVDQNLSEADTRVYLIDPVLRLLGYTTVGDVRREVPVPATREFIDYELYAGGKAQAIIEAKAVRLPVTDAAAAQCVQYASILGVRWCLVTNGVTWAIYNAHAAGPLPEKRVASVQLQGSEDDIREAWEVLRLFRRDSLASANPLSKLLAERVIADELKNRDSQAVQALRRAVRLRFNERISGDAVVEIIARLMGKPRGGLDAGRGGAGEPLSETESPADQAPAAGLAGPKHKLKLALKPDGTMVGIADLVEAGLLSVGDRVTMRIAGQEREGFIAPGGIEVGGVVYPSPSAAFKAAKGREGNGWSAWRLGDRPLVELRAAFLRGLGMEA